MEKIYDCILIGAGPAGSLCAGLLAKNNLKCLVLERLSEYGEKVCGGWVPNVALKRLESAGICLDEIEFGIKTKSNLIIKGNEKHLYTYKDNEYGLGVQRKLFDQYLCNKAKEFGAKVHFNERVSEISFNNGCYCINGYRSKYLVVATGARGLLSCRQTELYKKQSIGISEHIKGNSCLQNDTVYFWYEHPGDSEYFWAIPIGVDLWNIGLWCQKPDKQMLNRYEMKRKELLHSFKYFYTVRKRRGAFLGNVDLSSEIKVDCFGIGDFGGYNSRSTGEGLQFAFDSAFEVFNHIKNGISLDSVFMQ